MIELLRWGKLLEYGECILQAMIELNDGIFCLIVYIETIRGAPIPDIGLQCWCLLRLLMHSCALPDNTPDSVKKMIEILKGSRVRDLNMPMRWYVARATMEICDFSYCVIRITEVLKDGTFLDVNVLLYYYTFRAVVYSIDIFNCSIQIFKCVADLLSADTSDVSESPEIGFKSRCDMFRLELVSYTPWFHLDLVKYVLARFATDDHDISAARSLDSDRRYESGLTSHLGDTVYQYIRAYRRNERSMENFRQNVDTFRNLPPNLRRRYLRVVFMNIEKRRLEERLLGNKSDYKSHIIHYFVCECLFYMSVPDPEYRSFILHVCDEILAESCQDRLEATYLESEDYARHQLSIWAREQNS